MRSFKSHERPADTEVVRHDLGLSFRWFGIGLIEPQ